MAIILFNGQKTVQISNQVQYLDAQPIIVNATVNMTNPNVSVQLDGSDISFIMTNKSKLYTIKLNHTMSAEGIVRVTFSSGDNSITYSTQVKAPYLETTNDLPLVAEKGATLTLSFKAVDSKGKAVTADSITVDIIDPTNTKKTIELEKKGTSFTKLYKFDSSGEYIFHARASKLNTEADWSYQTKESTTIVNVTAASGIPTSIWIWVISMVIYITLFIIARIKHKLVQIR